LSQHQPPMSVTLGHCAAQSTMSQVAHALPYVGGNSVASSKGDSLLGGNPVFSPVQLQSALAVTARDASSQGAPGELATERAPSNGGRSEARKRGKGEGRRLQVGEKQGKATRVEVRGYTTGEQSAQRGGCVSGVHYGQTVSTKRRVCVGAPVTRTSSGQTRQVSRKNHWEQPRH